MLKESDFLGEGHRKVRARLRAKGIGVGKNRVLRLMRENGLLAPVRRGKHPRGDRSHSGRITTDVPNELWGTGRDAVLHEGGWVVLVLRGGWITASQTWWGWHVAKKGDRWAALEPIRQGVRTHMDGYAPKIALGLGLRHDWGPQYTAHQFQGELAWPWGRVASRMMGPVPPRLREPRGGRGENARGAPPLDPTAPVELLQRWGWATRVRAGYQTAASSDAILRAPPNGYLRWNDLLDMGGLKLDQLMSLPEGCKKRFTRSSGLPGVRAGGESSSRAPSPSGRAGASAGGVGNCPNHSVLVQRAAPSSKPAANARSRCRLVPCRLGLNHVNSGFPMWKSVLAASSRSPVSRRPLSEIDLTHAPPKQSACSSFCFFDMATPGIHPNCQLT